MKFLSCTLAFLCLTMTTAKAHGPMPGDLPAAFDQAVDMCLKMIDGQSPGKLGKFKKTQSGFAFTFSENKPGVLRSKFKLNGSNEPRVDIYYTAKDRVCRVSAVRLDGGYAKHFTQLRAAFARRGWTYKRGNYPMTKGERIMTVNGGTTMRDKSADVFTNFILIEWVQKGAKSKTRKY